MCKSITWQSIRNCILTAHVWKCVLCALNMKKVSEWEGDSVGFMWVKSFVWKRSGFSTQYRLLSLSSFSFLSVPTVHNLSIKAAGGTEREHKTETEKDTEADGDKWRFEVEEETVGQRGLSSSILERGKIRKARMRGVLIPLLVSSLSQLYFTWLKDDQAHVKIKRGKRDDKKKTERSKGW